MWGQTSLGCIKEGPAGSKNTGMGVIYSRSSGLSRRRAGARLMTDCLRSPGFSANPGSLPNPALLKSLLLLLQAIISLCGVLILFKRYIYTSTTQQYLWVRPWATDPQQKPIEF